MYELVCVPSEDTVNSVSGVKMFESGLHADSTEMNARGQCMQCMQIHVHAWCTPTPQYPQPFQMYT